MLKSGKGNLIPNSNYHIAGNFCFGKMAHVHLALAEFKLMISMFCVIGVHAYRFKLEMLNFATFEKIQFAKLPN